MLLKCRSCGKQAAVLVKKKDLENLTKTGLAVPPMVLIALIELLGTTLGRLWGWLSSENTRYIVCKQCGHHEPFDKSSSSSTGS